MLSRRLKRAGLLACLISVFVLSLFPAERFWTVIAILLRMPSPRETPFSDYFNSSDGRIEWYKGPDLSAAAFRVLAMRHVRYQGWPFPTRWLRVDSLGLVANADERDIKTPEARADVIRAINARFGWTASPAYSNSPLDLALASHDNISLDGPFVPGIVANIMACGAGCAALALGIRRAIRRKRIVSDSP